MIIDFHVHIFPDPLRRVTPEAARRTIGRLRRLARGWMRPVTRSAHEAQTLLRHLPEKARKGIDELTATLPYANLLLESTAEDLKEEMQRNSVDSAVVISHPPLISNDFIFASCAADKRLIAAVNIPRKTKDPAQVLRDYIGRGARILKLHPAADGEGVESKRYRTLLETAAEHRLPVILHTGFIHSHLNYRSPAQGRAERFAPWFSDFADTPFILAHMNFHEPYVALDLADEHANVYVDTSWQPAEMIGEAARRMGPERVLFATDWPLVGDNIGVGLKRVRDCVRTGLLTEQQAAQVLGLNAARLLEIKGAKPDAP